MSTRPRGARATTPGARPAAVPAGPPGGRHLRRARPRVRDRRLEVRRRLGAADGLRLRPAALGGILAVLGLLVIVVRRSAAATRRCARRRSREPRPVACAAACSSAAILFFGFYRPRPRPRPDAVRDDLPRGAGRARHQPPQAALTAAGHHRAVPGRLRRPAAAAAAAPRRLAGGLTWTASSLGPRDRPPARQHPDLPARRDPRHRGRRAARHRAHGDGGPAAADHLRVRRGRLADHARRHLLRRPVRRLDDGHPAQPAGRVVLGGDGPRRPPDGAAGAGRPALATAALGSFFAGTVATSCSPLFAPPLAELALQFGPADYFALVVLGLIASSPWPAGRRSRRSR